ncbi:hypothetical protein CKJ66_04635 [Mycobacterium avium]|uniref:Serine/threonine protein kinase n=1 Tax=Mycobacterium avium TaxID=1764 RepID=A0A2A2ZNF6_MYCAV|nr:hypothetical protein CKJ66_04635 [Mycobacterium avium]
MGAVAAAALVIAAVAGFVVLRSGSPARDRAQEAAGPTVDAAAAAALRQVLPRGYSDQNCHPAPGPAAGATAAVACDRADDVTASFALIPDQRALGASIGTVTAGGAVVLCPGRIQSPGPWRRGGLTQPVRGTLVCATPAGGPTLAWTDTDKHLLAVVHGKSLEQLYSWWIAHA